MIYVVAILTLFVGFLIGMYVGSDLERKFNKVLRAGGSVIVGMNNNINYITLRDGKPRSYPLVMAEFDFVQDDTTKYLQANTDGNDTLN